MNMRSCGRTEVLLQASRRGALPPSQQAHLAECGDCATALQIERTLTVLGLHRPSFDDLPDPTAIWWRSRQQQRLDQMGQATLPIQFVERLALVLGAIGLAIALASTWTSISNLGRSWLHGWTAGLVQLVPLDGLSLIPTLFGSLILLVGFGLYSQWAEI